MLDLILNKALDGKEISVSDALEIAQARDLHAVMKTADTLRERQVGDIVTYVVNRNINFTNVCIKHCTFCAFSRTHREEEGYFLPPEEIMRRVDEAVAMGATEVCLQAGLAPKMDGDVYPDLCRRIKAQHPNLHIHAFSPEEVLYGATRAGVSIREYLQILKQAGLDTLPGTSAELLDQEMRDILAPGRITVKQWIEVITNAHDLGIRTTSTIMFGHLETVEHWVRHMDLLRSIQRETGGFSEFVPLSFVHSEAPLYKKQLLAQAPPSLLANTRAPEAAEGPGTPGRLPQVRQGPTGAEVVRMHALARIMLGASFRNIQASWVKEGPRLAQLLLVAGCNDLGGTLINESISTSAGAQYGQLLPPRELRRLIHDLGRTPAQRSTLYRTLRTFSPDDTECTPLDQVQDADSRFGSYSRLAASAEHRFVHPGGAVRR
ncbi:MAG: CofH family radical SAM protein [Candidatus Xenobia bacterium]